MNDSFAMTMVEQSQKLPHDAGSSCLVEVVLSFKHIGQWLPLSILYDDEETVVIFEELVDSR